MIKLCNRLFLYRIIFPILCWGVKGIAFAFTAEVDTIVPVQEIPEIMVTGYAAPVSVRSAAPLQVIKQSDLAKLGVVDLSDAMRRFSGVNVKDYGGIGGLKTISVRSFGSQHTTVVYDGLPVSDAQNGQIDLSRFSLENVEQISLGIGENGDIFRPARLLASSAVLTIKTAMVEPDKTSTLSAQVKAGSFGLVNPYLRYGRRLGEKTSLVLYGDALRADGKYPFTLVNGELVTREKRTNTAVHSYRGEINLLRELQGGEVAFKTYYYDSNQQLPGAVILYNTYSGEELREQNLFSQLHWKKEFSSSFSLQLNGKYNWAASRYSDRSANYENGILHQNYFQSEYYISATLLYQPLKNFFISYAADYFYNELRADLRNFCYPDRHSLLQAVSASYTNRLFTVSASLLGSFYFNGVESGPEAKDINRLSPLVSVSYRPFPERNLRIRASYQDIFRMPTFNENYFDLSGSRQLKPEKARQMNLGITYNGKYSSWLRSLSITADGYYNRIDDKIVAIPNMFNWSIINLGKVDILGVDMNAGSRMALEKNYVLEVTGNYTYQHSVDHTDSENSTYGDQIPYTPLHSGSFSVAFENPYMNISWHITGASVRYNLPENIAVNRINGYLEQGISLYRNFRIRNSELLLRGDLINLTDK
ncbi:MAG: TonB-dependent receptor, partial [Bacteroides sp.]|nr:TonB-dependent receptor [Bacteroides sp.]